MSAAHRILLPIWFEAGTSRAWRVCVAVALASALLSGCRSRKLAPAVKPETVAAGSAAPSSSAPLPGADASDAAPDAGRPEVFDYATPSEHPFPKGPSDEVLCKAIHSKETDVWRRFGHFILLVKGGVIWVGPGTEADVKRIKAAVDQYEPLLIRTRVRACSRGGTLTYADADWRSTDQGFAVEWQNRLYTVTGLEQTVEKHDAAARRALGTRYEIRGHEYDQRKLDLCALNAEYCEGLFRLAHPEGLCAAVWANLQGWIPESMPGGEPTPELEQKCRALPASVKVCAAIDSRLSSREKDACNYRLLQHLGQDVSRYQHWAPRDQR